MNFLFINNGCNCYIAPYALIVRRGLVGLSRLVGANGLVGSNLPHRNNLFCNMDCLSRAEKKIACI